MTLITPISMLPTPPAIATECRRHRTPVAHVDQIAGQSATCVDVPVPGGTSVYCALTNGPLARLDDGAVSINLTQYSPAIAESLFATTGNSSGQASTATSA